MATMIQHSFVQQYPLSASSFSPFSSTSTTFSASRASAKVRIYSCCLTPLNIVSGSPELRLSELTETRFGLPSNGRLSTGTRDLSKDGQLSAMEVNALQRQYAPQNLQNNQGVLLKLNNNEIRINFSWAIQMGALAIIQVADPAMAVTGVNNEEDLIWTLLKVAIVAFGYFLIIPPIIMNWLRIRWYRRNLLEMYVQFMFVFIFFPGILVWAPFMNFRKFPRDATLKYPWSKPENPSAVKGGFRKFPWATNEDYE